MNQSLEEPILPDPLLVPVRRRELPIQALWLSSLVSIFGNTLTSVAVPWFVLELTGSATRTGLTAAVTLLPVIVMSFVGGAIVDRSSHKTLSVFADVMSAVSLAAVPVLYLMDELTFPLLLGLMALGAIFDAPGSTAREAMIPGLSKLTGVPLERINANFGMIYSISSLFAAPLAGVLIAWLGSVNVLWFTVGTFIFSALVVQSLVPALPKPERASSSLMAEMRVGFRYVKRNAMLRTLTAGALCINFVYSPVFGVVIPVLANEELQSARAFGIMLGGVGVGGFIGSWLYGKLALRVPRYTFLASALVLLSLPMIPLAFAQDMITATLLTALVGLGSGLVNPMLGTFIQSSTPQEYLGRVLGMLRGGGMVAQPAGLMLGGPLIALLGLTGSMLVWGGIMVVVAAILLASPSLRTINDDHPAAS